MKLIDLLSKNTIVPELHSTTKQGVIEEMADIISKEYPVHSKEEIASVLLEREKLGSTGIENGIAIPHAKLKDLDHIVIAVGKTTKGIDFQAHDGNLSHLFFVLLAPDSSAGVHLKTLARLSHLLKEDDIRNGLKKAVSEEEIYNLIKNGDENLKC